MHIIKNVKFENMLSTIVEVLSSGGHFKLTVTGSSMYPFLRENIDCVELVSTDINLLSKGDIVLVSYDGHYILHRIIRKKSNYFFTAGDSEQFIEGPFYNKDLIAVVDGIWRGSKYISSSNYKWKLLSSIWLRFFPLRHFLIKLNYKLRNFF